MVKKCLLLAMMFSCCAACMAADNYWIGSSGGNWHTASNWSLGHVPVYNTDGSEKAYIGMNATDDYEVNFTQYASYGGSPGDFYLGRSTDPSGTYTLNVTSNGFVNNVYSYIGSQGVINVNGGNYTTFGTKQLDGTVNVNSGTYKIRSYVWRIGGRLTVNAGSHLIIENGSRFSETSSDITVPNSYFTGVIDICGGEIQMEGDCTTAIAWHINNGNIRSHGGTSGVSYYYDSVEDKTFVTSTQVTNYWIGGSSGSWHTASNWSEGYVPVYNDNGSEITYLGMNATGDYSVDFTQWVGYNGSPGNFYLGRDVDPSGTYTLNVTSNGFVNNVYSYIGSQGVINVNGGNYTTFGTKQLDGTVNVNSGTYKIRSYVWRIGGRLTVNAGSYLIIENGSRFSETSSDITVPNSCFTGVIDICGGEMQMEGDCTTAIAWHINNGNIRSHGGASGVSYYYDSNTDCTIITSIPVNYWIGGSSGSWHTASNWSEGYVPVYNTDRSELACIGMYATGDCSVDFTQYASYGGSPGDFYLGRDVDPSGTYTLNIASTALFCNVYSYIGPQGVINVNGGNYTTFGTKQLDGIVNVNDGGIYKIRSYVWRIGGYVTVNAGSYLIIENGSRFSETSSDITVPNSYFTGVIDLCGGEMTMEGDCTTAVAWHINNGNIIAYGGSNGIDCYYDANDDLTYIIPSAYNEYPVDGDEYVMNGTVELVWETNVEIDSCNVYFGSSPNSLSYQTNTATGTWTCPALTTGQQYYWRIDMVDDATVCTGKVWSFKVADTPLGLYIEYDATLGRNILKHNGSWFKGYGINYITSFTRKVYDNSDTSYEEGFEVLAENNIPFVRVFGGGFYVVQWDYYRYDKEHYFEMFDAVMASAEENNIGVIFSVCFNWETFPALMGETLADWTDPNSQTSLFVEQYIRELYERYKNCPAFWGWEAGNEYNYKVTTERPIEYFRAVAANFHNSVRKVDKNRFTTNGFGIRKTYIGDTGPYYGLDPEIQDDHDMVDVASIHYYGVGHSRLTTALSTVNGWGQPLYIGEFGVSEYANLTTYHDGGYATVEEAFEDIVWDMVVDGITFASAWVFDYPTQNGVWNITSTNNRSYMLDVLSDANAALNP